MKLQFIALRRGVCVSEEDEDVSEVMKRDAHLSFSSSGPDRCEGTWGVSRLSRSGAGPEQAGPGQGGSGWVSRVVRVGPGQGISVSRCWRSSRAALHPPGRWKPGDDLPTWSRVARLDYEPFQ